MTKILFISSYINPSDLAEHMGEDEFDPRTADLTVARNLQDLEEAFEADTYDKVFVAPIDENNDDLVQAVIDRAHGEQEVVTLGDSELMMPGVNHALKRLNNWRKVQYVWAGI